MLIWTVAHIISKMPSPPLLRLGLLLDLLLVNHEAQQHLPVGQFKDLGRARLVGVLKQALQLDRVQLEEVRQLELRRAERLGVGLRGDRDGDGGVRGALVGALPTGRCPLSASAAGGACRGPPARLRRP